MILVTGSKGFIGGALVRRLRESGSDNLILVDDYKDEKQGVQIKDLFRWWHNNSDDVDFIFHLGANTNTLENDKKIFDEFNLGYSKSLWYKAAKDRIPMVYASSAATYGSGDNGYSDSTPPENLVPLNEYGRSKNEFDKFVLSHKEANALPFWAGLKFFNVYGFDESRKGRMASMVYHGYNQVKNNGKIRIFEHGEHLRDFVYVEDVVDVMLWLYKNRPKSGLYNVGTGTCRSFNDLARSVFNATNPDLVPNIEYFSIPGELNGKYQDYTQADMSTLRKSGYTKPFTLLEEGVKKYIQKLEE